MCSISDMRTFLYLASVAQQVFEMCCCIYQWVPLHCLVVFQCMNILQCLSILLLMDFLSFYFFPG